MPRIFLPVVLALMLASGGCAAGYRRGYASPYSPGCYSCGRTREDHGRDRHRGGRRGGGHHHRDHDHDRHHGRRH